MTNSDFPRILTLLRKERGFSQKSVASDLGISQALLSHYEKGIRECGLDFLVRAADYYGVSCDYLLGRTPHRNGVAPAEIPANKGTVLNASDTTSTMEYQRRTLINSLHIVFGLLKKINSEGVTHHVFAYFSDAIYKTFRTLYSAHGKSPQEVFSLDQQLYRSQTDAHMVLEEAKAHYLLEGNSFENISGVKQETLSVLNPEKLLRDFPQYAPSLFELVQKVKKNISGK